MFVYREVNLWCEHADVSERGDDVVIAFKPVAAMVDICHIVSFIDVVALVFNDANEFVRAVTDSDDYIWINVFGVFDSVD